MITLRTNGLSFGVAATELVAVRGGCADADSAAKNDEWTSVDLADVAAAASAGFGVGLVAASAGEIAEIFAKYHPIDSAEITLANAKKLKTSGNVVQIAQALLIYGEFLKTHVDAIVDCQTAREEIENCYEYVLRSLMIHHGSPEQQLAFFQRAAEYGCVAAMNDLALYYTQEPHKNVEQAAEYCRRGIERKNPLSMRQLGIMYINGDIDGGPSIMNVMLGFQWLQKAVKAGHAEVIAICKNFAENCPARGADPISKKKYAMAHALLGMCYTNASCPSGEGVRYQSALDHYSIAISFGCGLAAYNMEHLLYGNLGAEWLSTNVQVHDADGKVVTVHGQRQICEFYRDINTAGAVAAVDGSDVEASFYQACVSEYFVKYLVDWGAKNWAAKSEEHMAEAVKNLRQALLLIKISIDANCICVGEDNVQKLLERIYSYRDKCVELDDGENLGEVKPFLGIASEAASLLASCYEDGRCGLAKDEAQAVAWYGKSADCGNTDSMFRLGQYNQEGKCGLAVDNEQAVKWFRRAVDCGDRYASFRLGMAYEEGRCGLAVDNAQAVDCYRRAVEAGNFYAMPRLASIYRSRPDGLELSENLYTEVDWFCAQARSRERFYQVDENDHTLAQAEDRRCFIAALETLVDAGSVAAANVLGTFYDDVFSYGLVKDDIKAVRFYKIAITMAVDAAAGVRVSASPATVAGAAAAGASAAVGSTAAATVAAPAASTAPVVASAVAGATAASAASGLDTADDVLAIVQKALRSSGALPPNGAHAIYNLARFFEAGRGGVAQDLGVAAALFNRAAEANLDCAKTKLNNSVIEFSLGELYEKGNAAIGIAPNLTHASYWYFRAAENGHDDAAAKLQALADGGNAAAMNDYGVLCANRAFKVEREYYYVRYYDNADIFHRDRTRTRAYNTEICTAKHYLKDSQDLGNVLAKNNFGIFSSVVEQRDNSTGCGVYRPCCCDDFKVDM